MKVFNSRKEVQFYIKNQIDSSSGLGLVPTMGALHQGHLSLIERSKVENAFTMASIFVNPTQFDNAQDLKNYPRTIERDLELLNQKGCDLVFVPTVHEIYADKVYSEHFDFDGLEKEMEGKFRAGHFNGVGTIVKTLFEILEPTRAYFGEKDFQQLQIIKKMVEKTQLKVEIIGCPIYREQNGLAISSRNERLSELERKEASIIYNTLLEVKKNLGTTPISELLKWVENQFLDHPLFKLEYFSIADENSLKTTVEFHPNISYRAFIAVYAGEVRLIDNLALSN